METTTPWGLVLFLIFMVLKLTGNIAWSWWWVTSPLWIPLSLMAVCYLGIKLLDRSAERERIKWLMKNGFK